MPELLFADYLMASHELVNNNLDNLKKFIPATDVSCFAERLSKIAGKRTVARLDYHVPRMNFHSEQSSNSDQNQDSAPYVV